MPHPEHAVDPLTGSDDGLRLFAAAAAYASGREPAAVTA
jgi:phosphoribosylformylglycinamidine (FGAM) synthase-like amidotransferase family enzyme